MLVKKYQAKDMQEAMDTVVKELGSDAVILNSRKVRKKGIQYFFHKPLHEVMVAYDPAKTPAARKLNGGNGYNPYNPSKPAADPASHSPPASSTPDSVKINPLQELNKQQLAELDNRINTLDQILNSFLNRFAFVKRDITYDYSDEVEALFVAMAENQVREELAHSIAREAEQILQKQQGSKPREIIEHLILEKLGEPDPIQHKKYTQKVILVVGPTGVGKTTSIVKLAANFAVKQKKKVGIINTDTYRIAAQEQLRTYADILGIPLSIVYQTSDVDEELKAMSDREIVFIDTAGKRPGDQQHIKDITAMLDIAHPEDILLCVSATTGFSAMKEIIDTYAFIKDYKLVVTKLDETRSRGILLNLCWYTKKRLAYVTIGQNVPDDIDFIEPLALADALLSKHIDS